MKQKFQSMVKKALLKIQESLSAWNEKLTKNQDHLILSLESVKTGIHLDADLNSNSYSMTKQRYEDELELLDQDTKSIFENIFKKLETLKALKDRFYSLSANDESASSSTEKDIELLKLDKNELEALIHKVSIPWIDSLHFLIQKLPSRLTQTLPSVQQLTSWL
jgi:hypothetical protein